MAQLETLFQSLKDARRCLLARQYQKFVGIADEIGDVDTDLIKAELADKGKEYLDQVETFLHEYTAPLGLGKAIDNNDSLILALGVMAAKVTDTLGVVLELQARWDQDNDFPRELYGVFEGVTIEDKKRALNAFIKESDGRPIADIARHLKAVATLPQRKHKQYRIALAKYLPQLVGDDPKQDHSLNNIWNNNL